MISCRFQCFVRGGACLQGGIRGIDPVAALSGRVSRTTNAMLFPLYVLNPRLRFPIVTLLIIMTNLAVMAWLSQRCDIGQGKSRPSTALCLRASRFLARQAVSVPVQTLGFSGAGLQRVVKFPPMPRRLPNLFHDDVLARRLDAPADEHNGCYGSSARTSKTAWVISCSQCSTCSEASLAMLLSGRRSKWRMRSSARQRRSGRARHTRSHSPRRKCGR